jgi:hypothetical protein
LQAGATHLSTALALVRCQPRAARPLQGSPCQIGTMLAPKADPIQVRTAFLPTIMQLSDG